MNKKSTFIFLLIAISALGTILQIYITANGIGLSPDSRDYIEAADNLYSSGSLSVTYNGKEIPFIHLGPILPIILAGISFISINPIIGEQWLGSFLVFGNIFTLGLLINLLSSGSTRFALMGSLLFSSSLSILFFHSWAWSEPLFIFFILWAYYFFFKYEFEGNSAHLIISAVLFGLASLTQFVGALFIIAITVEFLTQRLPFWSKWKRIASFLVLSSLPMFIWSLRNIILYGNITNRDLYMHFITNENLQQFLNSDFIHFLSYWAIFLFVLVIFGKIFPNLHLEFRIPRHISVILISILIYLIGLVLSISFFDANTPLDNRILSPSLVLSFVAGFSYLALVLKSTGKPRLIYIYIYFGLSMCFLVNLPALIEWSYGAHVAGIYYASPEWKNSQSIQYVNEIPAGVEIYSNAPDAIYLISGKLINSLPQKMDLMSKKLNPSFVQEITVLSEAIRLNKACVILFSNIYRNDFPQKDEMIDLFGKQPDIIFPDGIVFKI